MQTINKQQILKQLDEQFGIKEIPKDIILIKFGEEKIFAFSGDLQILKKIEKLNINIAGVGNYVATEERGQIRLSIEGTHLFKNQISKNIFELNKEQKDLWMHGSEILLEDVDKNKFVDNNLLNNNKSSIKPTTKIKDYINNNKKDSKQSEPNPGRVGGAIIKRGFLIMKYKDDFLGTGKASENKIGNFIPKNRRLKVKN